MQIKCLFSSGVLNDEQYSLTTNAVLYQAQIIV